MESRNINVCLWDLNIELRDNGVLAMGTIIRIIDPSPIITYMAGNIPMIETHFPAIVICHPCQIQKANIDNEIKENYSQAMLHNGFYLNLDRTTPE